MSDDLQRIRKQALDRFTVLTDYAIAWLQPHEALLLLSVAADNLKSAIEREERDAMILSALRDAQENLPNGPALDAVKKTIWKLTDEGAV